jgi:hypothetical protein
VRSLVPLAVAVSLFLGCPPPTPTPDASVMEPDDAGTDAGVDAGRPPRDAGTPDAGFTAAPSDDWCELKALAECHRDVRCGRLRLDAVPGCVLVRTSVPQCDQTAISRGVNEGRQVYLESEAVRCLNAFASGSCEETPFACTSVFAGNAPADAGCLLAGDCSTSAFCDVYDGLCPHRCKAWEPLGNPCDGFFRRCDPRSGSCDTPDGGNTSICVAKKNEGDPCTRYDACGDEMTCVQGACMKRRAGPGEACGVRNGFPFCSEEYFCRQAPDDTGMTPPGTCERKAGIGDTCTGPGSCLPSLRCSTLITTGACLPKAPLDAGCIAYDDCQDGLYCDAKTQRCEGLPDAGGDCTFERTGYRCAPGFTCAFSGTSEDRCVAWKPAGALCGYDGECLSNDCEFTTLPDGGFGGTCIASCSQRADGGL